LHNENRRRKLRFFSGKLDLFHRQRFQAGYRRAGDLERVKKRAKEKGKHSSP